MNALTEKLRLQRTLWRVILQHAFVPLERDTRFVRLIERPALRMPSGICIANSTKQCCVELIRLNTETNTLSRQRETIDPTALASLFLQLENLKVAPDLKDDPQQGRDGSELDLTCGTAGKGTSSYHWLNSETPLHWEALDQIARQMQDIAKQLTCPTTQVPFTIDLEADETNLAAAWSLQRF